MRTCLSSERTPWGVLDSWVSQGRPLGVFTVLADHAIHEGWWPEIKGNHQGFWGLAVVDLVTGEPADRLHEALKQSQRRQQEGLGQSTQPWQIGPGTDSVPRTAAVADHERDTGARDFTDDRPGQMRLVSRYAEDRRGQGRWVRLHRFGVTIGTLWTDDAQALGFIREPGASVALLVNSLGSACAAGTPTSWVFADYAGWCGPDHWAGPVERGDLATLDRQPLPRDCRPQIAAQAENAGLPAHPRDTAVEGTAGSVTLTTMDIQTQAEQASADEFFESVARLGASPAPGATYSGTTAPIPLICTDGHACTATPSSVQRGQEICDTCADLGPVPA